MTEGYHRRVSRAVSVSDIELPQRVTVGRDFIHRVDQHGSIIAGLRQDRDRLAAGLAASEKRISALEKRLGALEAAEKVNADVLPIAPMASAPSMPAAAEADGSGTPALAAAAIQENHDVIVS